MVDERGRDQWTKGDRRRSLLRRRAVGRLAREEFRRRLRLIDVVREFAADNWLRAWTSIPPLAFDTWLAVVATVGMMSAITVAEEPDSRPPDAFAYILAVAMGLLMFGRRRRPRLVLLATLGLLFAYYRMDYPGVEPGLPLAAAIYSASVAGRTRLAVAVCALLTVVGMVYREVVFDMTLVTGLAETLKDISLFVMVILLGHAVLTRRIRLAAADERLTRLEREREREAARRIAEERLQIARDMHDVLAHTISTISVQAALADDTLRSGRLHKARTAVRDVRAVALRAMAEFNSLVGILRRDGEAASRSPAPGVGDLSELYERARDAGLRVEVDVAEWGTPLPAAVDLGVYRIVQESLTNALRHANADTISIAIRRDGNDLVIDVVDDGRGVPYGAGGPSVVSPGYGIIGMTERALALRGSLEAGPVSGGGFRVHARIPTWGGSEGGG
ncbi:sensor histidine kinase [Flindersiella endophytica]